MLIVSTHLFNNTNTKKNMRPINYVLTFLYEQQMLYAERHSHTYRDRNRKINRKKIACNNQKGREKKIIFYAEIESTM